MAKRGTIPFLANRLLVADTSAAKPDPKIPDAELQTAEHRAWRKSVLDRAGNRCEWVEHGSRCDARYPMRLYADHIVERKDGGAVSDVANGQCLCGAHHAAKTHAERRRRMAWRGG